MLDLNKCVIVFMALFSLAGVSQAAFVTNLSDTHVQSVLQNYFPLREYAAVARVTLQEPKVRLGKDNKDILLIIPIDANIIGDALHRGHVRALVSLSYKPSSGGLYLSNPRMDKLEMPSVNKERLAELRKVIEATIKKALPLVRIYKLKEQDLNHSLAKSALKSFQLEEKRLKLEFGFK